MTAKSLWYVAPRELEIREVDVPAAGPNQALVRVDACGVCTWDLFIFGGGFQREKAFPFYLGHEGVGTVHETGAGVSKVAVGDRVALRESRDIGALCTGHMAEYVLQLEDELVPLPSDDRPDEHWMIEPVACCINAVDLARIRAGVRVALVGCGFMGSIILELLSLSPASNISVFDLRAESLNFAASLKDRAPVQIYDLGAKPELDSLEGTFDVVIETAGVEPSFRLANRLVRSGGTLALFSWQHPEFALDLGNWHVRGITVLNTSPPAAPNFSACFQQAVPLIAGGRVDLSPLITHIATPEHAQALYEDGLSKNNGYIKGVIRWS